MHCVSDLRVNVSGCLLDVATKVYNTKPNDTALYLLDGEIAYPLLRVGVIEARVVPRDVVKELRET